MKNIQWYPGHIAKAEKKLKANLAVVDVVLEVLDARCPSASQYDGIEKLIGVKNRIIILNKADLADDKKTKQWKNHLDKKTGLKIVETNSHSNKDTKLVINAILECAKTINQKRAEKGLLARAVRIMAMGMPNVGKSSIINKLTKKGKAKTGHKAGVTRSSQWVRVHPKIELLDMPGIIPPRLTNQENAVKLAWISSVSDNAYDYFEVAGELAKFLMANYPQKFCDYYRIQPCEEDILEKIAIARNWIKSDKEPDLNRTAQALLADFRNGRIGKITLDEM